MSPISLAGAAALLGRHSESRTTRSSAPTPSSLAPHLRLVGGGSLELPASCVCSRVAVPALCHDPAVLPPPACFRHCLCGKPTVAPPRLRPSLVEPLRKDCVDRRKGAPLERYQIKVRSMTASSLSSSPPLSSLQKHGSCSRSAYFCVARANHLPRVRDHGQLPSAWPLLPAKPPTGFPGVARCLFSKRPQRRSARPRFQAK